MSAVAWGGKLLISKAKYEFNLLGNSSCFIGNKSFFIARNLKSAPHIGAGWTLVGDERCEELAVLAYGA
jgi:hypothetical protein